MQQFHLLSFLQISNSRQCQKPSKHCWKTSINKVGKLRTPHLPYPSALLSGWLPGQANCGWPWTFAQRTTTTTTPNTEDTSLQSMAQLLGVGISCWLNVPHLGAKLMRKVPGDKPPQNETFGRSGWVCKHFKDSEDSPKQSPEFQHTRTLAFMLARDVSLTFFN